MSAETWRPALGPDNSHVIDVDPDQLAYEVCARCGLAIDDYGNGRGLVTMLTGNPECYGR